MAPAEPSVDQGCDLSRVDPAKKPTMDSRERGRHYRERLKAHHRQIRRDVARLRGEVHDLRLLASLQLQLSARRTPDHVAHAISTHLEHTLRERYANEVSTLRFFAHRVRLHGPQDAPVVLLRGKRQGQLRVSTINRLYFCMPGNTALLDALLDRDVAFESTRTLYFSADGSLMDVVDQTDFACRMARLLSTVRGLSDVVAVLRREEQQRRTMK